MVADSKCRSLVLDVAPSAVPWSSLVEGDEGWIGPSKKLLCLRLTRKIMQYMHDIIPKLFECWADPVAPSTKELHGCTYICL